MNLKETIKSLSVISTKGNLDVAISGLSQDTRRFKAGNIFIAVKGSHHDGHEFLPQICAQGAAAVVVESPEKVPSTFLGGVVVVESSKSVVAPLAKAFYNNPSEKLFLAGVTGTNGKTTTTYILEALLGSAVIGTVDSHYEKTIHPASHTTPDPIALQGLVAEFVSLGAKSLAMEVSSHALVQHRADALDYDVGIFTNLTRDHMDFHKTIDDYAAAKARLFRELLRDSKKKNKRAVVNGEDPFVKKILPHAEVPTWTFGFSSGDIKVTDLDLSFEGTDFQCQTPLGLFKGHMSMVGKHNVANAMGALGAALHFGLTPKQAAQKLSLLTGVPGRLERVPTKSGVRVFVDYAHTDDGLVNVLGFLKQMKEETSPTSQIITVFGCGGDRDRGKRPLMMKAALDKSDFTIVTSDNPRTENPESIIAEIIKETPKSSHSKFAMDADRRRAIQLSIERANPGDVVLIAGKGHEKYQIIGEKKLPFDDVAVAKEILDE